MYTEHAYTHTQTHTHIHTHTHTHTHIYTHAHTLTRILHTGVQADGRRQSAERMNVDVFIFAANKEAAITIAALLTGA